MTKVVGILNITPDSFSDGGKYFHYDNAIKKLEYFIEKGIDVIDVGAESTRPNAIKISSEEEWSRLKNILPEIIKLAHKNNIAVSLDSYHSKNLSKALKLGIDYINDVSGCKDEEIIKLAKDHHVKLILNHNLGIPANKEIIIEINKDPICEVNIWFDQKINQLIKYDIDPDNIILDIGIGFGKTAIQSVKMIENIDLFKTHKKALYVGHSRKSFLKEIAHFNQFQNLSREQKLLISQNIDSKTHFISKMLFNNVDYIRVHNVDLAMELKK